MHNLMKSWIEKANNFRKNALIAKENNLYDIACFSAQQAVELVLKGLIVSKSGSRPFTHSLIELYEILEALDFESFPEEIINCLRILANHYLQARYPDSRFTEYTIEEAEKAIDCLDEVFDYVSKLLPENQDFE
ncbi:MAG: HEPN domain-containing protein [Candidatus Heimdallarchaeota archaeon]|nr:HEPN domain-containing protein [Candidatus Heimdallarchaeota archaeon]